MIYLYQMLADDSVAEIMSSRFDHILVDEYQDTNHIQAGILAGMRKTSNNVTVVGDNIQSINGFRSATVKNMMDFATQFPGTKIVVLEQNIVPHAGWGTCEEDTAKKLYIWCFRLRNYHSWQGINEFTWHHSFRH
jgi:ATP-dependent exoDNAse (exonuclease V) beta subunit